MREAVYISKHFDSIKKELIIEEDLYSIWAYIIDSENDNKIILDGFICSKGTIVKNTPDVKGYIDKNFAPPISEDYANEFSIQVDLTESDFRIEGDKDCITIHIKDSKFVILDLDKLKAYSKSLSKSGSYGEPLNI